MTPKRVGRPPARKNVDRANTGIRLDRALLAELDEERESRGVSRTWIIEHALRDWLDKHGGEFA